jgi:hypothetical protein
VQVTLDGVELHDMFADDDLRWAEGGGPADDAEVVRCQAYLTDTGEASYVGFCW